MARIRSIHPGLFTDEAFATLSSDAQMLLIGIWTEADDQGVFEWKPLTLRMRLRPAKDGDVVGMLDEIEASNSVKRFEVDGKLYGAVRNFRKWQRPEKPKNRFPLPDDLRVYVHLSPANPQPVADESPKPVSEEGGRRKEEGKESLLLPVREELEVAVKIWNDLATDSNLPKVQNMSEARSKSLKARLGECGGIEGWRAAICKVRDSPFLRGENDKGWKADFDFVLQSKSFTKLMEGSYDRRSAHPKTIKQPRSFTDEVFASAQPDHFESTDGSR